MKVKKTAIIYFSPTKTTEKVVTAIAAGVGAPATVYNFTKLASATHTPAFGPEDFVIIGLPVYRGRIPGVVLPYLRTLQGGGAACAVVGLYGNRHYDDFLVELEDIVTEQGFVPVAAAAFLGEHSFSSKLATGRPDTADLALAKTFGERIAAKLTAGPATALATGAIPGQRPYRLFTPNAPSTPVIPTPAPVCPVVESALCINCGACAAACPTGAINPANIYDIAPEKCIRCRSCAHVCPTGAVDIKAAGFWAHTEELIANFSGKKDVLLVL